MKTGTKVFLLIGILLGSSLILATVFKPLSAQAQQPQQQKPQPPPQKKQDGKKQEEEEQVLKVGTRLVNLLFSVTDKTNRYINDLKPEEITVLEDGKPQSLFTFKREFDLPLTMAILIDTSGSEKYVLPQLKDAGGHFIESVMKSGKDTAAIISFDGEASLLQGLTSNKSRLIKGLEEVAYVAPAGAHGGTPGINGNSRQGWTSIHDSIMATCTDLLAREAGRKTIILLTDGEDTSSRHKLDEAITEALRAEVVIYAIGIGDGGGINEGMLKKLTDATGGRAVFPNSRRELDAAFAQLEQDLRQQYLLAYEPSNEALDGSYRKLEVKIPKFKDREKEFKIRHRRGYYAPKS